jgi:hypothetical protein
MTREELDVRAKVLYETLPLPAPAWSQLGEVTKTVWRERAQAQAELEELLK